MNSFTFKQHIDMTNINSSLELNSDTVIADIAFENGNAIELKILGDVRVEYKGDIYKEPASFPADLMDKIKQNLDDDALIIWDQNWFELIYKDANGNYLDRDYDDNTFDAEHATRTDIVTAMLKHADFIDANRTKA
jgi:hypothetical protein